MGKANPSGESALPAYSNINDGREGLAEEKLAERDPRTPLSCACRQVEVTAALLRL